MPGVRGLIAASIVLVLLWVGALLVYQPASPPQAAAPPTEFSSTRALAVLQGLLSDAVPHPMGSVANSAVRERIVAQLRHLAYAPQLQSDAFVCDESADCGTPTNIVVRIPGTQDDSAAVLLAAHYDSVPAGPGASDDGTGVAVVLEIARILQSTPRMRHPIVLLIDDGEEAGLLGARSFVDHHPLAKSIAATVNIDNRGTSGPSLMFETGSANRWLMRLYAQRIAHPVASSLFYAVYKLLPNDTDFTVFKSAGYQGFNFANIGDVENYHTPRDDLAHVTAATLQQHGDNALAALRALADGDIDAPPAGEAVYFDVFGKILVSVPQGLVLPAAVITLLLILALTAALFRRQVIALSDLAWSLGGLALAYITAAALPIGLIFLVRAVNAASMPLFSASPWVLESTCAAMAIGVLCAASLALSRRARFWGLWSASAVWTASLALLLAVKLPGASYIPLLPTVVGMTGMFLRLRRDPEASLPEWVTLVYVSVSFCVCWPILIFLYEGLGRRGLPLLVLLPVFAAAPLIGLLQMTGRSVQRVGMGLAVLGMLIGAAVAAKMPAYTIGSPQALNLHYVEELADPEGSPRSHWLVSQRVASLAPEFSRLLPFAQVAQLSLNPLLVLQTTEFWADAPPLNLVAPTLNLVSAVRVPVATAQPDRVRYELHIAANATVSELNVAFAPQAKLRSVHIGSLDVALAAWDGGWSVLSLINPPAAGMNLSFEAADGPFDISMVNVTYGLPAAGANLLKARPSDTIAIEGGNDTRVLRTVHMPQLPRT